MLSSIGRNTRQSSDNNNQTILLSSTDKNTELLVISTVDKCKHIQMNLVGIWSYLSDHLVYLGDQ